MQNSNINNTQNQADSSHSPTVGKKILMVLLVVMTVFAGLLYTVFKNSPQVVVSTENKLHEKVVNFLKDPSSAEALSTLKDPSFIEVKIEGDVLNIIVPVTNVVENKELTQTLLSKTLAEWVKTEFPNKPPTLKVEIMQ